MGKLTLLEAVEGWRAEIDAEKSNKKPSLKPSSTELATTSSSSLTITQPDGTVIAASKEQEDQLADEAARSAGAKIVGEIMEKERLEKLKEEGNDSKDDMQRDTCIPTEDEVDDTFDEINTLRYLQPTHLDGKFLSLSFLF